MLELANYERTAHLKSIHAQRKASTLEKVDQSIKRLLRVNKSINFNSVSEESGVSKASLYNHSDIREKIESLRRQQSQAPTSRQVRCEMNDANKDVLIETLKRKIKVLENENKELREEMKRLMLRFTKNFSCTSFSYTS